MKKLLILGAGGHGRCCLDIARSMKKYEEISFLDDDCPGTIINGAKVIGKTKELEKYDKEEYGVFVAIGNNNVRKVLYEEVQLKGFVIETLISPKCVISEYASIGNGTVIYTGVVVVANTVIKKGCIITSNVSVNHDSNVDGYCVIYSNTVIRPNVQIGEGTRIGCNCVISFGTHISLNSDISDGTIL